MSHEIVAKVEHNAADETLTIFSCSNNVTPKTFTNGHTITASSVRNVPAYVETATDKVMYVLYRELMMGTAVLKSSVSAKYRNAYNVVLANIILGEGDITDNNWDTNEYFILFLNVVAGTIKPTTGAFVISTDLRKNGIPTFYKNPSRDTFYQSVAKVFKTEEEAIVTAKIRIGATEVVAI